DGLFVNATGTDASVHLTRASGGDITMTAASSASTIYGSPILVLGSAATDALTINGSQNIIIGLGEGTGTVTGNTLRGPNATGTDIAGPTSIIAVGKSTGTGNSGVLQLQGSTSKSTQASSSTANTVVTLLQVGNTNSAQVGLVGAFLS